MLYEITLSVKQPRKGKVWKLDLAKLIRLVDETPGMMLEELVKELGVSVNEVFHSLKVLGYSHKKIWQLDGSYLIKLEKFKRKGHYSKKANRS